MPQFEAMRGFDSFSLAPLLGEQGIVTKFGTFLAPVFIIGGALLIGYFVLGLVRKGR